MRAQRDAVLDDADEAREQLGRQRGQRLEHAASDELAGRHPRDPARNAVGIVEDEVDDVPRLVADGGDRDGRLGQLVQRRKAAGDVHDAMST